MKDIMLDENNDLIISNGDFVLSESLLQETKLIMQTAPGHWRYNPILGLDMERFINDEASYDEIKAELKKQLKLDGKRLKEFQVVGDQIKINVERV